jgi:hypothetical protein
MKTFLEQLDAIGEDDEPPVPAVDQAALVAAMREVFGYAPAPTLLGDGPEPGTTIH